MVRGQLGAIASFKKAVVVEHLPSATRGRILRGIAGGECYKVPSTIDDPAILPEIKAAVATMGYGSKQHTS